MTAAAAGAGDRRSWKKIRKARAREPGFAEAYDRAAVALELAEAVYRMRVDAGLTQRELAERVGTTQSAIARLELGGTMPTLDLLARLAGALGRSVVLAFTAAPAERQLAVQVAGVEE